MHTDIRIEKLLAVVVVGFSCFLLALAIFHPFLVDEFQHIHNAWLIKSGSVPYVDFFEHHNSLYWYTLVPFLKVFGENTSVLLVLRLCTFLLTMGMGRIVYSITKDLYKSHKAGLFSVLLLFSVPLFVQSSIEIRPDVPQVLFGLLSVRKFIRFLESKKERDLYFSAFFAAISFVFLQKSILYLAACALFLLFMLLKKSMSIKQVVTCGIIVILPFTGFILFQISQGALADYFASNWLFNLRRDVPFFPAMGLLLYFVENSVFWVASFYAVIFFKKQKKNIQFKFILWLTGFYWVSLLLVQRPWGQYFLFPVACLTILCASRLNRYEELLKSRKKFAVYLSMLFFLTPILSYSVRLALNNKKQLEVINFVLENSKETDVVVDYGRQYNLFRPDLHYIWFDVGFINKNLKRPKRVEERLSDFDIPRLIQEKRPAFITDYKLNVGSTNLSEIFRLTRFQKPEYWINLYVLDKKE